MKIVSLLGPAGTLYSNSCWSYFFLLLFFDNSFHFTYILLLTILSLIQGTRLFVIKASNSDTWEEYNENIIASHIQQRRLTLVSKIGDEYAVFICVIFE